MVTDIRGMNLSELTEYMESLGEKKFRASQVYRWIHVNLIKDYEEMGNIPASIRSRLAIEAPLYSLEQEELQISEIDGTRKYLFKLQDGNMIEAILCFYNRRTGKIIYCRRDARPDLHNSKRNR